MIMTTALVHAHRPNLDRRMCDMIVSIAHFLLFRSHVAVYMAFNLTTLITISLNIAVLLFRPWLLTSQSIINLLKITQKITTQLHDSVKKYNLFTALGLLKSDFVIFKFYFSKTMQWNYHYFIKFLWIRIFRQCINLKGDKLDNEEKLCVFSLA